VVEDINGQAKEVAGEMTGREVLERDGEAQVALQHVGGLSIISG
jgi:uncharacterized protein YjbJ (UPF0337 family)